LILALDIGNTLTHLAVYDGKKIIYLRKFPAHSGLRKNILKSAVRKFGKNIDRAGVSSVVPGVNKNWRKQITQYFSVEPIFVNHRIILPISLNIKSPQKLGADRICNATAGYEYFGKKQNVIAVDFGTAITYDVVLRGGNYIGGIISPGIETMAKSLNSYTSKLPKLKSTDFIMPKRIIGKNTVEAIKSGTLYAALASFEGIVDKISKELKTKFKIVITGGHAPQIHSATRLKTVIRENLVLDGINSILMYNYVI
jgi:type III pantothenate kinase